MALKSFIRFIPTNLESIIFDYSASHEIPTGVGPVGPVETLESLKKKGVWKRGKQTLIEAGLWK